MAFEFTIEQPSHPGASLSIRLSGRLTLGPQLPVFGRRVADLLSAQRPPGLLLKMSEVEDVDSAGLGELVVLYTIAGHSGCRLCLVGPSLRVLRLLETTKLSGILPHFDDALAASAWILELA